MSVFEASVLSTAVIAVHGLTRDALPEAAGPCLSETATSATPRYHVRRDVAS
jgi:hypothetical protein